VSSTACRSSACGSSAVTGESVSPATGPGAVRSIVRTVRAAIGVDT
jgi:hypothetical protein